MHKIILYSIYDLIRSRWTYVYFAFYLVLGLALLFLNNDLDKGIITLMNVILILTPLVATIFGIMYFYNSREFTLLLLAQPLKRKTLVLGQYFGVSLSLSLSLVLGLGIPFVFYGLFQSGAVFHFLLLLFAGGMLNFIFVALAFLIGLYNDNKIKGFGYAILLWLFFAVIYDGLFLILLVYFNEYPLDRFALIASLINPIDLSRILVLLELDISALLGYTGAIFKKFFGTQTGLIISLCCMLMWTLIPLLLLGRKLKKKDF